MLPTETQTPPCFCLNCVAGCFLTLLANEQWSLGSRHLGPWASYISIPTLNSKIETYILILLYCVIFLPLQNGPDLAVPQSTLMDMDYRFQSNLLVTSFFLSKSICRCSSILYSRNQTGYFVGQAGQTKKTLVYFGSNSCVLIYVFFSRAWQVRPLCFSTKIIGIIVSRWVFWDWLPLPKPGAIEATYQAKFAPVQQEPSQTFSMVMPLYLPPPSLLFLCYIIQGLQGCFLSILIETTFPIVINTPFRSMVNSEQGVVSGDLLVQVRKHRYRLLVLRPSLFLKG